ncbi:MAG: acylphosphatase [Pseudobdellovibrionaceae bacterium]
MIKRFQILVSGNVQGVGFRRYALRKAIEIHILGWVRNLVDGRVEVMAQGQVDDLQKFVNELSKGPIAGCVQNVETRDRGAPGRYGTFEVWPDGDGEANE